MIAHGQYRSFLTRGFQFLLGSCFLCFSILSPANAADAVQIALDQHGRDYVLGANGWPPTGANQYAFDCSGLTWYAYGSIGIELAVTAETQSQMSNGTYLPTPAISTLQRGDLLFFDAAIAPTGNVNHVGIYLGNGQFVHARDPFAGVLTESLDDWVWKTRIIGARRFSSTVGTPSSKFAIGDRVSVTEDGVSVRQLRQMIKLGSQSKGSSGNVVFGPVKQSIGGNSYWWWYVEFDSGVDGWVAETFLSVASTSDGEVIHDEQRDGELDLNHFTLGVGNNIISGSTQFVRNGGTWITRDWDSFYFELPINTEVREIRREFSGVTVEPSTTIFGVFQTVSTQVGGTYSICWYREVPFTSTSGSAVFTSCDGEKPLWDTRPDLPMPLQAGTEFFFGPGFFGGPFPDTFSASWNYKTVIVVSDK